MMMGGLFFLVFIAFSVVFASNSTADDATLAVLEGMDMSARLKSVLTTLKTVSAKNPTVAFWKTVTDMMDEGGAPSTKYRMLSQEFERRAQVHLPTLARKFVAILHDEKFKAAASGVDARKQLSEVLSMNAEVMERLLDSIQYSTFDYMPSIHHFGFHNSDSIKKLQVLKKQSSLLLMSCVMIGVESLFLVTEKLPESEELMKELMPVVHEILELRRFAKVELSKEMRTVIEKIQTAYEPAFEAYQVPIYKRDVFKYGLSIGFAFSIGLAMALWILLRRPNMKPKAKPN